MILRMVKKIKPSVQKLIDAHAAKAKVLFDPNGKTRAGNSWAASFWAGYDGLTFGPRVPPRNHADYDWYAAGREVRRQESK